ncbi:MAG TPA: DUF456 domain-containing protein [Acidimicrobiia bacterium]
MEIHDFLAGIAVLIGLIGIVVVLLPGLLLQVVAVLLWALEEGNGAGWLVLAVVVAIALVTSILKWVHPGRRLREAGIPGWLLTLAVLVAVVGLFAVPVIGAPIGFVLTIYSFERARKGRARAWPSTNAAVRAVLASLGIELTGGLVITVIFFTAALLL